MGRSQEWGMRAAARGHDTHTSTTTAAVAGFTYSPGQTNTKCPKQVGRERMCGAFFLGGASRRSRRGQQQQRGRQASKA